MSLVSDLKSKVSVTEIRVTEVPRWNHGLYKRTLRTTEL